MNRTLRAVIAPSTALRIAGLGTRRSSPVRCWENVISSFVGIGRSSRPRERHTPSSGGYSIQTTWPGVGKRRRERERLRKLIVRRHSMALALWGEGQRRTRTLRQCWMRNRDEAFGRVWALCLYTRYMSLTGSIGTEGKYVSRSNATLVISGNPTL